MPDPALQFREEVALVKAVVGHPAAFSLDFGGGLIFIRTTDQETIEVEWSAMVGAKVHHDHKSFPVEQLDEASAFFVSKRHELRLGFDFEHFDFVEKAPRRESPR
jgi:hypothetical protein